MLPAGEPAAVHDRTVRPPGVLPRHAQTWVVLGIAALMTGIIAISGPSHPSGKQTVAGGRPAVMEPNDARIEEYRSRVEEEARRLAAAQADLESARRSLGGGAQQGAAQGGQPPAGPPPAIDSSLERERARREYQSLFADNIALTLRPREPAGSAAAASPAGPHDEAAPAPPERAAAPAPGYVVREGTVIEGVLTNRLDGSFAGPVNAMVTSAVYSTDRQHLLIPQGTRLLGDAKAVASLGQQRLAVTFHRLVRPDGHVVTLDQARPPLALGETGDTGLRDQVDRHYARLFGVSLAIGLIGGFAQADARVGLAATGLDAYREGVAGSAAQASLHILDRFLNVLPTVTIREGQRLKVYLAGDLTLPSYEARP